MNTAFKKRAEGKWTWISPDWSTKKEYDLILSIRRPASQRCPCPDMLQCRKWPQNGQKQGDTELEKGKVKTHCKNEQTNRCRSTREKARMSSKQNFWKLLLSPKIHTKAMLTMTRIGHWWITNKRGNWNNSRLKMAKPQNQGSHRKHWNLWTNSKKIKPGSNVKKNGVCRTQ